MAPLEDRSKITISTKAAEGASYEYIRDYTEDINALVDSIIPDAEAVTARVSSGSGNVQITLKDIKDRDYSQMEVLKNIESNQEQNEGKGIRPAAIFFRRKKKQYACTICIAGDQHRKTGKNPARIFK